VPVPITCPLLVTVTSLPEAARPAITSAPAGSTRTTSNDGATACGCDIGLAPGAAGVSVDGGTAACCVAAGAAGVSVDGGAAACCITAGAVVVAAVLFETEGPAASAVTPVDPAPAWAAFVLVVVAVFWPVALTAAVVVCDELADGPVVEELPAVAAMPAGAPPLASGVPVAAAGAASSLVTAAAFVEDELPDSLLAEESADVAAVPVLVPDPAGAAVVVAAGPD
jgi:hypothetical protein